MPCIQTPNDLELLIHCHVSPDVHPRADAPAIIKGTSRLVTAGMIRLDNNVYTTTAKGAFYLRHLLKQPFPVETYEIPEVPDDNES
ncbi:hypothetical protein HOV23_gp096 [Pseudomonas phage Lana]|uniref:Uncharacterized protein n=1 Tax=Pseudomonas phage Lana TaxID=2530172 RepID=A0A481W6H6_9CAUD|nr:hypothetical protein HOV23_gp096 [Pseudomonas phage Lana]QBJ04477.1 hypothetical protein [Pseudomonas phage Lana]